MKICPRKIKDIISSVIEFVRWGLHEPRTEIKKIIRGIKNIILKGIKNQK